MRKLFLILLTAALSAQGCSPVAEKPLTAAANPVAVAHQASGSAIKVTVDTESPETQSYQTNDRNIGPSPSGIGMVYRKVNPSKVMGDGKIFNVYTNAKADDNHFIPSGWMGDYGDLKLNDKYFDDPHSGGSCIQIVYTNKATQ